MSLVEFHGENLPLLIPDDLHGKVYGPATHYLYEWKDYWLKYPDADHLHVGSRWEQPIAPDIPFFRLRFENQLGIAAIQPFSGSQPLAAPFYVEVISPKFPTLTDHLNFYRSLLDDLFARAARLPFTISSDTSRSATEALRPPTPLFTLHFLCQYAPTLRNALAIILAAPHRQLHDNPDLVSLAEVTEADADVLLDILHAPERWVVRPAFAG